MWALHCSCASDIPIRVYSEHVLPTLHVHMCVLTHVYNFQSDSIGNSSYSFVFDIENQCL